MNYTDLDIRMKENYENRSKNFLTRRIPVIIRVDGKSFHTFCKRFSKPYDIVLNSTLNSVMQHLCKSIQGAKFAERHSDEISILVTDYDTITTDAFFDYNVQKICSVVASIATAEFCKELVERTIIKYNDNWPTFDCRCFNIPEEEIINYFWWRMGDAKRGSINMHAQANFSHKELQGLTCDQMQEKMWKEKGINWGKLSPDVKIGCISYKHHTLDTVPAGPRKGEEFMRSRWVINGSPSTRSELATIINDIPLRDTKDENTEI